MSSTSGVTYASRPDATPEREVATLAAVYKFILDHHAGKAAGLDGGKDAEEGSDELDAKSSIPREQ